MIIVVDCKGIGINKVELNSVVFLCGATIFYKRYASASPALSQLRQVGLYGLTIKDNLLNPYLSGYF